MKIDHMKQLSCMLVLSILLSACSALSPEPTPTPTPEPTATPIPPTPTPAPSEILSDGWGAYDSGDLETAAEIVGQVIEQFPEDGEAYALLGAVMVEQGELVEAIEQLETARDLGYEDANTDILLLQSYADRASQIIDEIYATWDYEEIRDLIYKARDYIEKARTSGLGRSDRIAALDAWFNREWDLNSYIPVPVSPAYEHWSSAADYEESGDYKSAVEEIEIAVLLDLETPELHANAGDLNYNIGDYEAAVEHYLDALELNPDLLNARISLGYAYIYNALPLHSRETFITAMLAIPDREGIETGLNGLSRTFATWQYDNYIDYGFRFTIPPDGRFSELDELMELSANEGVTSYSDNNFIIGLVWMPINDLSFGANTPVETIVSEPPMALKFWGEPTAVGDPMIFEYNSVPITYQVYQIPRADDQGHTALAIYALWKCDSTVFILNQLLSSDDLDRLFMFNPFFESVTCDLESIVPEHP